MTSRFGTSLFGIVAALALVACAGTVTEPELLAPAERGLAPPAFEPRLACGQWERAVHTEPTALAHVAFPEAAAPDCYAPLAPRGAGFERPRPRPGCGYPDGPQPNANQLETLAAAFERWGDGQAWSYQRTGTRSTDPQVAPETTTLPFALSCPLSRSVRERVGQFNARTVRYLARALESGAYGQRHFAYGAVLALGFGTPLHDQSDLLGWLPGASCPALDRRQMELLGVNRQRAFRAAAAAQAQAAPVVIASGAAVHSGLAETFLLTYLMHCRFGLPLERILLEPCARHTHENLRNSGGLVVALGARHAYIMTDPGLQAAYLGDRSLVDWFGFSIDQRSLRDFGFLVGSWRSAAHGFTGGFWYTPYRFWASPEHRDFTCLH